MEIRIAHLYYNLMNLYGENANIRALEKGFKDQNIKVKVDLLSIENKIDFNLYDIFYMGMGSEESQELVIKDIIKYKDNIKKSIEDNKYFFMTGNSYEIFGKSILTTNKVSINTLGIFDYKTEHLSSKRLKNASKTRIVGEIITKCNLIEQEIIGFQNRCGLIYDNNSPLFKIIKGIGSNLNAKFEGFNYKNFYGTYIIGPLFIRNPYLTNYFIKRIVTEKKGLYKPVKNTPDIKAYEKYLEIFKD